MQNNVDVERAIKKSAWEWNDSRFNNLESHEDRVQEGWVAVLKEMRRGKEISPALAHEIAYRAIGNIYRKHTHRGPARKREFLRYVRIDPKTSERTELGEWREMREPRWYLMQSIQSRAPEEKNSEKGLQRLEDELNVAHTGSPDLYSAWRSKESNRRAELSLDEAKTKLASAIATLDPAERYALDFFIHDRGPEAALWLQVSTATAYRLKDRAISKLRAEMGVSLPVRKTDVRLSKAA